MSTTTNTVLSKEKIMSGTWEPYLGHIRDRAALRDAYTADKDRYKALHDASEKSDMRQIGVMMGAKITDYRDDPAFLAEAREICCVHPLARSSI
jgi:predicted HD phosphohydrolase